MHICVLENTQYHISFLRNRRRYIRPFGVLICCHFYPLACISSSVGKNHPVLISQLVLTSKEILLLPS
jgi:hypothetical protein